ncbi:hypothetical protein F5B18DRAFT_88611 [Nemania serpens]|nr:hypothetical protein F5B18DRAFT_88611 [Nemania serpens]
MGRPKKSTTAPTPCSRMDANAPAQSTIEAFTTVDAGNTDGPGTLGDDHGGGPEEPCESESLALRRQLPANAGHDAQQQRHMMATADLATANINNFNTPSDWSSLAEFTDARSISDPIMGKFSQGAADASVTLPEGLWNTSMPPFTFTDTPRDDSSWHMGMSVQASRRSEESCGYVPDFVETRSSRTADRHEMNCHSESSIDASNDGTGASASCKGQCYILIIQQLTQFEQHPAVHDSSQRLDHIMAAVQDVRNLKDRLFQCHGRCNLTETRDDASQGVKVEVSCLESTRPCLLLLAVFIERVVGILEGIFCRAASAALDFDRSVRATWYMTPPTPAGLDEQSAHLQQSGSSKRLSRSVRSTLGPEVNCPVPEANCELKIGNYELDNEAKGRAMKAILRLRISAVERTIAGVAAYPNNGITAMSPRRGSSHGSSFPGVSRRSITQVAAATLVADLHRRVELLQGRLELAG